MRVIKRVQNAITIAVVTTSVSELLSLTLLNTPSPMIEDSDELLHIQGVLKNLTPLCTQITLLIFV